MNFKVFFMLEKTKNMRLMKIFTEYFSNDIENRRNNDEPGICENYTICVF